MNKNQLKIFLAGVCGLGMLGTAQPITMDEIRSLQSEYSSAAEPERLAFLEKLAQEGELAYQRGEDPRQLRLKMAAIGLLREDYDDRAERIYIRMLDRAEDPLDIAVNARVLGSMYRDRAFTQKPSFHWQAKALQHYQLVVDTLTTGSVKIPSGDRELEFAVNGLVNIYQMQKNPSGIVDANAVLFDPRFADTVSEEARQRALRSTAGALKKLGSYDAAVAHWDRLLREYPQLGMDDGSRIRWLRLRAAALDPTRSNDAYIAALGSVWTEPAFRQFPGIADVGLEMTRVYRDREWFSHAAAMGESVAQLVLEMEDSWPVPSNIIEIKNAKARLRTALVWTMNNAEKNKDYALAHWAATVSAERGLGSGARRQGVNLVDYFERKHYEALGSK